VPLSKTEFSCNEIPSENTESSKMHSLATSRLAAPSAPVRIALPYARNRQEHPTVGRSYANAGRAATDSSVPASSEAVKLGNNQQGAST
jgi:hypothetical protein